MAFIDGALGNSDGAFLPQTGNYWHPQNKPVALGELMWLLQMSHLSPHVAANALHAPMHGNHVLDGGGVPIDLKALLAKLISAYAGGQKIASRGQPPAPKGPYI